MLMFLLLSKLELYQISASCVRTHLLSVWSRTSLSRLCSLWL